MLGKVRHAGDALQFVFVADRAIQVVGSERSAQPEQRTHHDGQQHGSSRGQLNGMPGGVAEVDQTGTRRPCEFGRHLRSSSCSWYSDTTPSVAFAILDRVELHLNDRRTGLELGDQQGLLSADVSLGVGVRGERRDVGVRTHRGEPKHVGRVRRIDADLGLRPKLSRTTACNSDPGRVELVSTIRGTSPPRWFRPTGRRWDLNQDVASCASMGVAAIDNNAAVNPVTTIGMITNHFRRQMTAA